MTTTRYTDDHEEFEAPDDLDRLMTRLQPPQAPRSLVAAVLGETTRREARAFAGAQAALWAAYAVLFALVAGGAVLLGTALNATGTLDFLAFALTDSDLLRESPALFTDALTEHMPWGHVVALAVTVALWVAVTVVLLRRGGGRASRAPGMPA